jgi:dTDP-3-amino-3,4,6-trideoxy-alpha-D-glucose transaminase
MISSDIRPTIPFTDFVAAHEDIRREVECAILRVLNSGRYILGTELAAFEDELACWLGVNHVVGVANGTDALILSFLALGVRPGDEIITTDMTAIPTIVAIQQVGAVPVPVDINVNTGLIDVGGINNVITTKTRGIVPVHLYGRSCDMTAIEKVAKSNHIWIVEDCAQAIGSKHNGRMVGSFGNLAALSFYPTKNLGAYGDAGAVLCNDKYTADKVRSLRNYGQPKNTFANRLGINSRLDEIQAAILRVKLPHLQSWLAHRRSIASKYRACLPKQILPSGHNDEEHVHHLFPVLVSNRDVFRKQLLASGIETLIHYPLPVHRLVGCNGLTDERFPFASRWSAEVLSLPLHPFLDDKTITQVIEAVTWIMEKSTCLKS